MQVECKFIFSSIEELHEFTGKVANAGASVTGSAATPEPAKKTSRSSTKKNDEVAAAPTTQAPAEVSANPFAGMNTGAATPPPAPTAPVAEAPAVSNFNRQGILDATTKFIQDGQAQGLQIAKIAELINTNYFIPRGLAQCPARDLTDFQLADFYKELQGSITQAAIREINAMKGASLV